MRRFSMSGSRTIALRMLVLILALTIGSLMPVRTEAQGVTLPDLAPTNSVRERFIRAFNGRPLRVCQWEYEKAGRDHGVCHDLVTVPEQNIRQGVHEFVSYDGTAYRRFGDERTWTASRIEGYNPNQTLNQGFTSVNFEAVVTRIGPANVAGIPAIEYQYWSLDRALNERVGGQFVFDVFISSDNRVVARQRSHRGNIPGLGMGEQILLWTYYDHNTPIKVGPPPAGLVK